MPLVLQRYWDAESKRVVVLGSMALPALFNQPNEPMHGLRCQRLLLSCVLCNPTAHKLEAAGLQEGVMKCGESLEEHGLDGLVGGGRR